MSELWQRFQEAVDAGVTLVEVEGGSSGTSTFEFARSVASGLSDRPKWLDCRFLYDAEGSRLFEQITEQPEYYLTRIEAEILEQAAPAIRQRTGPVTLVELGSGSSTKTRFLLDAYHEEGRDPPLLYVPVDVSESALEDASQAIQQDYSDLQVTGIAGSYASAFQVLRGLSPQMVIFLGSSVGNFHPEAADWFWRSVARSLPEGDFFLLGVDLVKDRRILEAAYDDAAGVTRAFTRNLFARMNRELGSELDLSRIQHVARWNPRRSRIDIHARFETAQEVRVAPLQTGFPVEAGEEILVEISTKYELPALSQNLLGHGFRMVQVFTDPDRWFALLLLQRVGDPGRTAAPGAPPRPLLG